MWFINELSGIQTCAFRRLLGEFMWGFLHKFELILILINCFLRVTSFHLIPSGFLNGKSFWSNNLKSEKMLKEFFWRISSENVLENLSNIFPGRLSTYLLHIHSNCLFEISTSCSLIYFFRIFWIFFSRNTTKNTRSLAKIFFKFIKQEFLTQILSKDSIHIPSTFF